MALVLGGVVLLGLGAATLFSGSPGKKDASHLSPSPVETSTTTTTSSRAPSTPPRPKAVHKLADHPIFAADVGANALDACPLPPMDYSPAGEKRFLEAALPCVEKVWQPALKAAGLPYHPAELRIFTGTVQAPCGPRRDDEPAMFCRGGIYWPSGYYAGEGGGTIRHPGVYLGQLAHEYGHHVQWLTGLLGAADQARHDAGGTGTPKGLELNRRLELQATCFGGMTLAPFAHNGVVPLDVVNTGLRDAGERGDHEGKPDHGSGPNNVRWVTDGHRQNRTGACNTWAAPAGEVS